ncbi:MAG TPA: hypothetical protein VFJ19_09500 [Nocardioidaceae bacterium]|nr:hypothetical protein [Nocardioidaceae bacterium]
MSRLGNSMDLPFENNPTGTSVPLDDALISGGVVVMAAVVPVDGGPKPALVFRFSDPHGRFYPPMVLVADDDQMAKTTDLVSKAVRAARAAAKGAA